MSRIEEIYVSTDIETDGPIPGVYSMLSLASAGFRPDGICIATFSANIEPLEGAKQDPETMSWWKKHPEAWDACTYLARPPDEVMKGYCNWVNSLSGHPVFVAYPAGFDFTFVYWYLIRYVGWSPFRFGALDIKTYAMAMLGKGYREISKRTMPRRWFGKHRHSHVALDDAIEQGLLFYNMLKENLKIRCPDIQG